MPFDVFISYKHSDNEGNRTADSFMAEDLYHALKNKGINTFFSHFSILEKGEHRFGNMINEAIDECSIFIAVSTNIENLKSRWVHYEIECFNEEMLNGNKPMEKCAMFSYLSKDVPANKLPMELRHCQAFYDLDSVVTAVCKRIENAERVKKFFNMKSMTFTENCDNNIFSTTICMTTLSDKSNDMNYDRNNRKQYGDGDVVAGRYKIVGEIGRGGMSRIYRAIDISVNFFCQYAIKIISHVEGIDNDGFKKAILTEINMMKNLSHLGIPLIFDVIDDGYSLIIVMEYIEGKTLDKIEHQQFFGNERFVVDCAIALCDILIYLGNKEMSVIHRDIKPANIILKPDGSLKLIDFGSAREYKNGKTEDTVCLGTRGYAAPEQYGGMGQTDIRTDIYCLGMTLHNLCTGIDPTQPPYEKVLIRQINKSMSFGLEYIVQKCTQNDPNKRYQNATELKEDFLNIDKISKKLKRKHMFRGVFSDK